MPVDDFQIPDVPPRNQYVATEGQTNFPITFPFFEDIDIKVRIDVEETPELPSSYTITGAGTNEDGELVFAVGRTAGEIVTIYRDSDFQRTTNFQDSGDWQASNVNDQFNRIVTYLQEVAFRANLLGIALPITTQLEGLTFPDEGAAANADRIITWNPAGDDLINGPSVSGLQSLFTLTNEIEALAAITDEIVGVDAISTQVVVVNNIADEVENVSAISTEIVGIDAILSELLAIHAIIAEIVATAAIDDEVVNVSGISTQLLAVEAMLVEIQGVYNALTNVNIVADNITDVNSFANIYRIGAADPATSLDAGDLFYNSTTNVLKYYNGAAWQTIAPGITDVVQDLTPQLGGNLDKNGFIVLEPVAALGSIGGGTQDVNLSTGIRSFSGTVDTSTTTFTFSNPVTSGNEDIFTLRLTNGGSQIVNWPASVLWVDNEPPELTAAGVDELVFKTIDGGTTWSGAFLLNVS